MGTPRYVVLDEADEMLKKDFYEQITCKTEKRQHTRRQTELDHYWTHDMTKTSTWRDKNNSTHIDTLEERHWDNL